MNLDLLWRQPLQSPDINKAVTQTAYEVVKSAVKTSADYRVLAEESVEIFEQNAGIFDHSDISALTRVFRYDFRDLVVSNKIRRAPRLNNLLRFCEEEAKDLGLDLETRGRLYQRGQRLREINQTVEELILYRNYSAHHTHERNDLGLCFKVSSSLLRYVELLDIPSSWAGEIEVIRNSSIRILSQLYHSDPTSEFGSAQQSENNGIQELSSIDDVMGKLDLLTQNVQTVIDASKGQFVSHPTQERLGDDDVIDAEEIPEEIEYEKIPELMTLAQLRQKLLETRKEIAKEFKLISDDDNILSEKIINDIVLLGVSRLVDWKKLPSSSKVQINMKDLCSKQLELYWDRIEQTLSQFDWEIV
jgi:hypothetical protein